ncbi:ATP-binding protein [Myxococcus faecalis]|uniref:AAA family ATPase n=1 Tax=Myxococcus faecalis TaxID=3115646 RepID=UPI003CF50C65
MPILHVSNFYALRRIRWPLEGVSVLTGANGSGKTTALLALKAIRAAFDRSLPEAVSQVLGGSYNLRNHAAAEGEPVELGIDLDDLSWRIRLIPRGATVDSMTDESLCRGDEVIFRRDSLGNFSYRGAPQELPPVAAERLGLRWVTEVHPEDAEAARLASLIRGIHVYHDPDLHGLREGGSRATEDRHLHTRGRNVFTMLRQWRDRRDDARRFVFVDEGMKAAFPGVYESMDFDAGQTITARIYRPGAEVPNPISHEANGVVSMLMLLAQVASAEQGGVVAIDEPEHALHPFAIRRFIARSRAWARQNELTILLTTHSPVLLNQFNAEPERIFVLEPGHEVAPVRLNELHDRNWLANYTVGELYVDGVFAANEKT